jgi:RHS repeat-associated protein
VHYRDAKGTWQPIDTRIGRSDRAGFAYGATKNSFGSLFGARSDQLLRFEQDGRQVTVGLPGAARALTPRVQGSQVTYPGALGGADLVYQVTPDGVRKQIVLARRPAQAEWTFTLGLGGVEARPRPDGSIALVPEGGEEPLFVLPRPFMVDAVDDPASPYGKRYSDKVTQTVVQRDGKLELRVRADAAWLADPARRYPVKVDPTIKIQPVTWLQSLDVEIREDLPTTNLDHLWQLAVGTLAAGRVRSLVKFPLSDIPSGTQIDSAQLMTYFDGSHTVSPTNSVTIEARRVTASWSDTTATWNSINSAFAEAGLGTATRAPNQSGVWHSFNVRNIVQSWLNGTANHGFMLKAVNETLNQGGPIYEAAPGLASYDYDYGGEVQNGPKLIVSYGRPSVTLQPPTRITATGAQLSWTAYADPSTSPNDDLVEYQVHRRLNGNSALTPMCGPVAWSWCRYPSRIAVLPPGTTSYQDTSAPPTPANDPDPAGDAYDYWIVVKTRDGQVSASQAQVAWLPKAGRTKVIIQGSALDTTLSKTQATTNHDVLDGRAWLGVGNNSTTYGVTRALAKFTTTAVPAGVTVLDTELSLWGGVGSFGTGTATYNLHKLNRSFNETVASWNNAGVGTPWTTPGGEFNAQVLASQSGFVVGDEPKWRNWKGPNLNAAVQGWVNTPSSNFGFLLKTANETTAAQRTLFMSSEAVEPAFRPRLTITYTERTPENTYHAPATPERMDAGDTVTVPVTITNTTAAPLRAADYRLGYKWMLPDGTVDPASAASQVLTPLPADLAPGATVTVNASLKAVTPPPDAGTRAAYVPTWDLFNPTTNTYLSQAAGGVAGLGQKVGVEKPTSDELGLEKFYQYAGKNTGAGTAALVNQHAGNLVWSYDPLLNPSRGPDTFLRLTYNSLDTSASAAGFGWSVSAASVMRLGTPLDFHPPGQSWPRTVRLTDGDGTTHTFTLNTHGSTNQALWDYDHPHGVHLYLQKLAGSDDARRWRMTRPDRTEFLFDADGYQSATRDKNGNELLFTYERRKSNNKPIKFLKYLTDAAARQTLTLTTYTKGQAYDYYDSNTNQRLSASNLTNPHIIDQIASITDISGRQLKLVYSDKGLLKELVDGAGNPSLAKTFLFDYDATQGNKNVKLVKVTDPRGNNTRLDYMSPPADDPKFHWRAKTITDRLGNPTSFAYVDPDGPQGDVIHTTVTDPEQHTTFYRTDAFGRPDLIRDAKQQETLLTWDADHNVTRLEEDNGAVSTWTYDPKTGLPLTITDAQAVADGTPPTTLSYQTSLNGFVAELTEKRSPQGRTWRFGYDAFGNLTSVTDPKGTATPSVPNDFVARYEYDAFGQLSKATDANEHDTLYGAYDSNGYPRTITDARTKNTLFTYDERGNVLTVTDPKQKVTRQTYDLFGRPLEHRVPKDQDAGQFIVTPPPVYDRNDNITASTAPNGAVTSAVYDAVDLVTSISLPKDAPSDPARTMAYTYDKVGNLRTQTEPKGTLTTTIADDFVTTNNYDEIYQLTEVTNAEGDRLSYAYDSVGNVVTVIDPNKNASADPADFTARYGYDLSHRLTRVTDAAGRHTDTDYDLDGQVVGRTDQEGNATLIDLDERAMPREVRVPHDNPGGTISYHTTHYEYDEVGNQTRVISPRGVATTDDPDDFATSFVYDELDRVVERRLPFDRDDSEITTPDTITYSYDDAGNLVATSAPPSAGQTVRNTTTFTHFDNGWVRAATDPWDIVTTYDYNQLSQQTLRTITSAGGSSSHRMTWDYTPDGKRAAHTDEGVPVGLHVVLVDNSDTQNVALTGTWQVASSGSFQGFDHRTAAAGTGASTFTWKLQVPQNGSYEVFVRYATGTATNAPYRVEHSGGSTTRPVDQTQQVGQWVSLGSFTFTEGDGGAGRQVVLSNNANGTVVADAVKLVRANGGDVDAEGKDLTYKYDPNGNLVSSSDASSDARVDAYTVAYDGINRVAKVEERNGGLSGAVRNTTSFTYDPNGNPASRTHDDEFAEYAYDSRDLVQRATIGKSRTDPDPKVTSFTYTARGQRLRETKANGNTVDHTYFLDGLLRTQMEKKANGTLVSSHTIAYDANGDRVSDITRKQNADNHAAYLDHTYAYVYDPRDRVRQVTKSATGGGVLETETYTNDANNNVTRQTVDSTTTSFEYDRNRLMQAVTNGVTANYNYDPFGRLDKVTAAGILLERYAYDGFDRVAEHRKLTDTGSTSTTRYTYDPLDRTASRTKDAGGAGEKRTDFNYLGLSGEVVSEEIAGDIQASYQYSLWGERLSQVKFKPGGVEEDSFYGYSPHTDVETLTSETGDTRATYGYTAYGRDDTESFTGIDKPDAQDPTAEPYNPYRFNAKRFDPATGDYDMGFRDYDPGLNRFLSRDMYNGALSDLNLQLDPWNSNRYAFAGGNPISIVEFDGHFGWSSITNFVKEHKAEIVGAVVGIAVGVGCTALTAGAGALGCAALGGAIGSMVTHGMTTEEHTVGGYLTAGAIGAASGMLGHGAGKLLQPITSKAGGLIRSWVGRGGGAADDIAAGPGRELVKREGTLTVLSKAKQTEIDYGNILKGRGYDVVVRGTKAEGADLVVNGVEYELKTLKAATQTAVMRDIQEGLKQGGGRVIINGTPARLSHADAIISLERLQGAGHLKNAVEVVIETARGRIVWTPPQPRSVPRNLI